MKRRLVIGVAVAVVLVIAAVAIALGLHFGQQEQNHEIRAATPPMGWGSWNTFRCEGLNQPIIEQTANLLISKGLSAAGYVYVKLDDCWQLTRNSSGHILPDTAKFPGNHLGFKGLADSLHQKGLKFGLYTSVGSLTGERRPGSLGHEVLDSNMYAYYGVDFVKGDTLYLYPNSDLYGSCKALGVALNGTGRPIVYSIKGTVPVEQAKSYSNMRRVSMDIWDDWDSIMHIVDTVIQERLTKYARPGFWNDLDMLEVGNGLMTQDEYVAHFVLWCAFKSPLFLGNNIAKMDGFTQRLLTKRELVAVNQDPLGISVDLISNISTSNGIHHFQVVSAPCDVNERDQHWLYDESLRQIKHLVTQRCLKLDKWNYLSVESPCKKDVYGQMFWKNREGNIQLLKDSSTATQQCVTSSTYNGTPARLRSCDARNKTFHWTGSNQWWHGFNDAFTYVPTRDGINAVLIKNTNNMCLKVGGPPDLHVYAGLLSGNRIVAVFLNRDVYERDITLDFSLVPGLRIDKYYLVRDLYLEKDISQFVNKYTARVKGHSVQIVSLKDPAA